MLANLNKTTTSDDAKLMVKERKFFGTPFLVNRRSVY